MRRFYKPELTNKIGFLPLRKRMGGSNGRDKITIVTPWVVMRRDHVDIWIIERCPRHAMQRSAVDHQMIWIELFDKCSDAASPLGCRIDFVACLPAQNGRLIPVSHAGVRVLACEQITNSGFEV